MSQWASSLSRLTDRPGQWSDTRVDHSDPLPAIRGALGRAEEYGSLSEVTMISAISGSNGLAVLITLAVVATVWVLLTVRSSRPKNR